jgi:hypothetical protein
MGIGMIIGSALGAIVGWAIEDVLQGVLIGFLLGAVIGSRGFQGTNLMQYPPHIVRRLIISAVLFFGSLFSSFMLLQEESEGDLSIFFAIAPTILGMFFVYTLGSAIASLDELQRRIQVEAIAIGFGITAVITIGYGLLGFVNIQQANWLYVSFVMVLSWGIGKIWTMWKYK